jgi:hypothetical protein
MTDFLMTPARKLAMSQNGKNSNKRRHAGGFYSSEAQSRRRLAQLNNEQKMAADLEMQGFQVFSPTVVCDRVAVKDGKVFFVEFKKRGQALRAGQQIVCNLMPENYLVRYADEGAQPSL